MPHTMLRFPTVKDRTGLSRSTIYLRISRGTFPAPVSLGGGTDDRSATAGAEDGDRARGRTPRPAEKGWST